jgi:uncharacterized Zn finger protein
MTREGAEAKGRRYLVEGRLTVVACEDWQVEALCKGDSGHMYVLGYTRDGWWCECPATRCSHLVALQLVTAPRRVSTRPDHAPTRPAPHWANATGARRP